MRHKVTHMMCYVVFKIGQRSCGITVEQVFDIFQEKKSYELKSGDLAGHAVEKL